MRPIFYCAFFLLFSVCKAQKKCYDLQKVLQVKQTPQYQKHVKASQSFGTKLLETSKTVDKYKSNGVFKKVNKIGKGYKISNLEYSRPYLNRKAKKSLEKIAEKFNQESNGSTLTISSLTRTMEDQCRLRKVNRNAALGLSSHNYGNAFDISYVRFNNILKFNPRLEAKLEKVLEYYRKAGRIFYVKEKYQSCFHITVLNY